MFSHGPLGVMSQRLRTTAKAPLGGKSLFQLTLPGYSPSLTEVNAGTNAETVEEYCSLVCLATSIT